MKFVIATGGSGGHLFPSIQVARELERQGHEVCFLGSFRNTGEQMNGSGFPYEDLNAKGFVPGFSIESFRSVVTMIGAVGRAFMFLRKIKPDVVLGFGGYGAFPVVVSAVVLRRPTLIHEQNVIPGRANSLLSKWVNKVAISFSKSAVYFNPEKTVLTGCPCHSPVDHVDREKALNEFHLDQDKKTIFVLGGSQGSQRINQIFLEAVPLLKESINFQVIHVSGKQDYNNCRQQYDLLGIPFALFEFLDKMEEAYCAADLVISRSGAVTVSEIASFQLPAVFIPYPYAQDHQKANASVLCEHKTSRLVEDKDLSISVLVEQVLDLLSQPINEDDKVSQFNNICFPDAAQRLAQEAVKLRR